MMNVTLIDFVEDNIKTHIPVVIKSEQWDDNACDYKTLYEYDGVSPTYSSIPHNLHFKDVTFVVIRYDCITVWIEGGDE